MRSSTRWFMLSCSSGATLMLSALVADAHDGRASSPSIPLAIFQALDSWQDRTTIAVYGDAPYGTTPTDTEQFDATPAFIDSINADADVELVIHAGDIHSGKQYCTEAYDRSVYDLWTQFDAPLIYTPGDNEWTDCHKAAEGGGSYDAETGDIDYVLDPSGAPVDYARGNPTQNLDLLRSIFFARPGRTLGGSKRVLSQNFTFDPRHPSDAKFVENVLWAQAKVVFATVNVPGGSNNDQDVWYGAPVESAEQAVERTERTGAALRWLDLAFGAGQLLRAKGVVLVLQADMWDPEKGAEHQAGYEPLVSAIARHVADFPGPVLMINGDSHVYLSDNPLSAADPLNYVHPGHDLQNFRRVVVHGSTSPLEWLRLSVDPDADEVASEDGGHSPGSGRSSRSVRLRIGIAEPARVMSVRVGLGHRAVGPHVVSSTRRIHPIGVMAHLAKV
jgi:hypothetical protein